MTHPVTWFEVLGNDAAKLQKFYGSLFGWKFQMIDALQYGMVNLSASAGETRSIPGGIGRAIPGTRSWVTFYVETSDVTASLDAAKQLGGAIVMPRTVLPDVTLGVFEDPEGHVVGLVEKKAA